MSLHAVHILALRDMAYILPHLMGHRTPGQADAVFV